MTKNDSYGTLKKTDPSKQGVSDVALREVSRCLDALPDGLEAPAWRMYKARGGKPGGWSAKDQDAWCHALTHTEDELELRGRFTEVRAKLRDVRRRLENQL